MIRKLHVIRYPNEGGWDSRPYLIPFASYSDLALAQATRHRMKSMIKHILAVVLMFGAVVLTGCDTLDDAARNEPRTKTFSSPARVVYDAVKAAANTMGYRFVRGGPAQGEFEAVSGVAPGEQAGTAQQLTMKVRLHGGLDGASTDVSVRFTQILEEDSRDRPGMATEATMRDTPLYEVFFRAVQQALDARPNAQPVK